MSRVVTVGETMALLDPVREGELELGDMLRLRFAGAESNFAVGLARLGVDVAWVSRLGTDRFGALISDALAAEGVDVRWVRRVEGAPTGLFYKWRSGGRTSVAYHRRGSAASGMEPGDVPDEALAGAALVHLTGITLALGAGPRGLVADAARRAREAGALVTFDPNYRPALWDGPADAAAAMEPVLEHVSWFMCGAGEGEALLGADVPGALAARGVGGSVVRTAGNALVTTGGSSYEVAPAGVEAVVDEIGAGDAFAAGFVYGLLSGRSPEGCARGAHAIAAWALRGTGDWETLPRLDEVRELL